MIYLSLSYDFHLTAHHTKILIIIEFITYMIAVGLLTH